jgi:hypothetical protein
MPTERRRETAIPKIELGITDLCLGITDSGPHASLHGRAFILYLFHSSRIRRSELRAIESGLDFTGTRIDHKQEIAFFDDIPVPEVASGQRAADMASEFGLLDHGNLAEKAETRINIAHQRFVHEDCGSSVAVARERCQGIECVWRRVCASSIVLPANVWRCRISPQMRSVACRRSSVVHQSAVGV